MAALLTNVRFIGNHAFNLALLAKQGWRILENPSSLIARIYKVRYFPQNSFWEAQDPVFPSYSWRSIWATRDLLLQGMRWQIDSGTEITTWIEPWIPKLPPYLPIYSSLEGSAESVVADFILPSRVWDKQKVMSTFEPTDAALILALSLSDRSARDCQV